MPGLLLLAIGIAVVPSSAVRSLGLSEGAQGFNLGDGFVDFPAVQSVSETPYWDNFDCPTSAYCSWVIGTASVPSAGVIVLSTGHCPGPNGCGPTRNGLVEFSPSESAYSTPLLLNCTPQEPFYPGVGDDVYVPCFSNANDSSAILVLDYQTGGIVGNISDPIGSTAMAYDPANGLLYSGQGQALQAINPQAAKVEWTVNVPSATFNACISVNPCWFTLVYDPLTDQLIAPSTQNSLLAINPTNGTVAAEIPLQSSVVSLAIDSSTKQLFAATSYVSGQSSGSAVTVFNALSYRPSSTIEIPGCVDYVCAEPDDVNVMLIDPTHGDLYLIATVGFLTLNLSSLSVVGVTEGYGDGNQGSAVYVPGLDQIIGTYPSFYMAGPGFLVQLHHSTYLVLGELLWQPPLAGVLTASQIVIGIALFAVFWKRERTYRLRAGLPRRRFGRI